jgi:SAM-dependent methyltransferase
MTSLYDLPQVYLPILEKTTEVIQVEVHTIRKLLERRQITGGKVLEVGCRTAAHGRRLAQVGFQVTAIDPSESMLAEARRRAKKSEVALKTIQAGEVDFDLDEKDFDAAVFMYENFPQITNMVEIVMHFASVRRHLKPGGAYIFDVDSLTHGIRRQGGMRGRRMITFSNGYAERWYEDQPGDWVDGTNCEVLNCRIMLDGSLHETSDAWCYRMYTPWDLRLLAGAMEGWRMEGAYSWRGPEVDLSKENHYFALFARD